MVSNCIPYNNEFVQLLYTLFEGVLNKLFEYHLTNEDCEEINDDILRDFSLSIALMSRGM